jgi:ferredoxin-NADP reductase
MLAMLRHVVYEGVRKRRVRRTWFIHGSRNEHERGFLDEVAQIAESSRGAVRVLQVLNEPSPAAREGVDFHAKGRVDLGALKAVLPFDDFDFYLCGPPAFMQDLYTGLRSLNVANERIHAESFGAAGLRRDNETALPSSSIAVPVLFEVSGKEARWTPGSGSLLDLAETRGLSPAHSCRQGMCGSCSHTLVSGRVTYLTPPSRKVEEGKVLLCQALPAEGSGPVVVAT